LDGRVDSIEVKIKKLDAELAQCRDKMARLPEGSAAKNSIKQQAMRILQQKRMYENQRGMMMQQSFNMEQTNFATESVKDTVTVVQAMKVASKDMKKTMRKLDISQIEVNQKWNLRERARFKIDFYLGSTR
jgi:charged multivesicular body protein 5